MKKIQQPYLVDQDRNNRLYTLQRDNDIIAMLVDGKQPKDIVKYIADKYGIKKSSAQVFISNCRKEIKERTKFELQEILSIHLHRYELIYEALMDLGARGIAMNALKAKEKLMGFHREGFHMKVSQGEIQEVYQHNVKSEYNEDQLPSAKRVRFKQLLLKAKREDGPRKGNKSVQRVDQGV